MTNFKSKVNRTPLLKTPRFDVEQVSYTLPDGAQHTREIVRHPGAVVILPILDDGRICLIWNYRVAVEKRLLELPAGTREPDEPPIETARRELIEETGFHSQHLEPLCEFYMSPGILDERMYAFVATQLTPGAQQLERGEQISNHLVDVEELQRLLNNGHIEDSKTLSTLLFYLQFHR